MISSLKKFNILILMGAFCLIYNPPILPFNSMHVVGAASIAYLVINYPASEQIILNKKIVSLFGYFIVTALYLLLVALISDTGDIGIVTFPLYFILDILPFGAALCLYMKKHSVTVDDFIELIFLVSCIQCVLAAMAFFIPEIKNFFMSRFIAYGYDDVYAILAKHRMFGFSGGLTYATPALQSFMSVVSLAMIRKKHYMYIIYAPLLFVFAFINARLAAVVLLVGLVVFFFLSKISWKRKISILLILFVFVGFFWFVFLPLVEKYYEKTYTWLVSGMEEIFSFLQGDSEGYFDYINDKDRYELPKTIFSIIFGCGHSIQGGYELYGVYSDIGYINDIWRGGVLYMIPLYVFMMKQCWNLYKNKNKTVSTIGILALAVLPVLNIKGTIYSMNDLTIVLFLLVTICIINNQTAKEVL